MGHYDSDYEYEDEMRRKYGSHWRTSERWLKRFGEDKGLPEPLRIPPTPPSINPKMDALDRSNPNTVNNYVLQTLPNLPGVCHVWRDEIIAWARGELVQWRYKPPTESHLQLVPGEDYWRDCDYPSRGMPNWYNEAIEFRVSPTGAANASPI